jgi:transketolase
MKMDTHIVDTHIAPAMKLADHLGHALARHADADHRIFVLDGDLADSDGALHFAHRHPGRFLMSGIAEQNMVSVAAGMAECGRRPWVFSFAAFLCYRAYDQVRVCLSQCRQPVTLVGSHAGGLAARNGKTHAAPNDLALMLSLPGMGVWAPADAGDVELAVAATLDADLPTYIRLPRRMFAPGEGLAGTPAPLRWLRPRRALTLLSTGLASHWALEAADALAARGIEAGVLHCARLHPLPPLAKELAGVQALLVVEDHARFGGLAALVAQLELPCRVRGAGWPPDYAGKSGSDEQLRAHYGLCPQALAAAAEALNSP